MSTPRKPEDRSPLGQLKAQCRANPALRDELFKLSDELTSVKWREQIRERFGIEMNADSQVSRWRAWCHAESLEEKRTDLSERLEELLAKELPTATPDEIRTKGLAIFMGLSLASQDQDSFLAVVDRERAERHGQTKTALEREKIEVSKRRVAVLEKKLSEVKSVAESTLSAEEQRLRLKEILK